MVKLPWLFGRLISKPPLYLPKVYITKPDRSPVGILYLLIFAVVFYVYIGGVYDILRTPPSFGSTPDGSGVLFVSGSLSSQYILEGVVAGASMFLGAIGLYTMHYATYFSSDVRRASTTLIAGIVMLAVGFVILFAMFTSKGG